MLHCYTIWEYGLQIALSFQHYNVLHYIYQQFSQETHLLPFTLGSECGILQLPVPI